MSDEKKCPILKDIHWDKGSVWRKVCEECDHLKETRTTDEILQRLCDHVSDLIELMKKFNDRVGALESKKAKEGLVKCVGASVECGVCSHAVPHEMEDDSDDPCRLAFCRQAAGKVSCIPVGDQS